MMEHYGLAGWKYEFMYSRHTFGTCNRRTELITLSVPLTLINHPGIILNAILREIAHALCAKRGHGSEWREKARKLCARPEAKTYFRHGAKLLYKYSAFCNECEREYFSRANSGWFFCRDCRLKGQSTMIQWKNNPWQDEVGMILKGLK